MPAHLRSSERRRLRLWTVLVLLLGFLSACGPSTKHYALIERSLQAGDPQRADQIMEAAEDEYDSEDRVLYWMDRGMTLHLAGRYEASNQVLRQAEHTIDELYTRRIRTEAKAFLVNDTELPFEGDPYEHVMINVISAFNYAAMGQWAEALVEARKMDHRLNVLADRVDDADAYRNDAFARYVIGMLYEASGDLNNAFIAYRNAYEEYQRARSWSRTSVPEQLKADLLRTSEALFLHDEHARYRQAFEGVHWRSAKETKDLAQLVVISYNGRAPRKDDIFVDLPISAEALHLVLLTKGATRAGQHNTRVAESVLYGLSGQVVRVALPRLVPQKSGVHYVAITAQSGGHTVRTRTELVQNLTAVAEKNLRDQFAKRAAKAIARAALKFGLAEGAGMGARVAAGKDAGPLVGLLVGLLGKVWAVSSEEADKRSWRTLPDEIQLARLWLPPGEYHLDLRPVGSAALGGSQADTRSVSLQRGETRLILERIVQ